MRLMTERIRLFGVAAAVVVMGVVVAVLGAGTGDAVGTVLVVLGAALAVLGVVLVFAAHATYGPARRLPEHLRQQAPPPTPHNLVLSDGRRIAAIAVFRGGYVRDRARPIPLSTLREVVSVSESTAEDLEAERLRQQAGGPS